MPPGRKLGPVIYQLSGTFLKPFTRLESKSVKMPAFVYQK